jgi:hypothetical protein
MVNAWAHVRFAAGLVIVHALFFLVGADGVQQIFPSPMRLVADYSLLITAAYVLVALIILDHLDRLKASRLDRGGR